MSEMRKQLPSGDWISFQKLSAETTDVDVQAFLAEKGIELPLERISVDCTTDGRKAYAIISLQRSHIVDLVWRAIGDDKLRGHAVVPVIPQNAR